MKKNIILSYPRSGNHLVRFFIELLSEVPTFGCSNPNNQKIKNIKDIEIYKNLFSEKIPFNIKNNFNINNCYFKYHSFPTDIDINNIIFIVRNPQEVLLNHNQLNLIFNSFDSYFKDINKFNSFSGKKILFFYEDIITNKTKFINELYDFLNINNLEKKKYVIKNINKLYNLSLNGKRRSWGGNKSNNKLHFYYKKLNIKKKYYFDNYLNKKLLEYPFLKEKYKL